MLHYLTHFLKKNQESLQNRITETGADLLKYMDGTLALIAHVTQLECLLHMQKQKLLLTLKQQCSTTQ